MSGLELALLKLGVAIAERDARAQSAVMEHDLDLGFLDITCQRCGARDCPFWEGSEPGEWMCEPCKEKRDGGDRVSWLMESEGILFLDAIKILARRDGLPIPGESA